MADKREQIFNRLEEIAKTVTGIVTVKRNVGIRADETRPAIIVLDGDEQFADLTPTRGRSARMSTTLMEAQPEIYVLLKELRPQNKTADAEPKNVGTLLNEYRKTLLAKIADDEVLLGILGPNGKMDYRGCVTDLKSGNRLSGEMRIDINFVYPLDPRS